MTAEEWLAAVRAAAAGHFAAYTLQIEVRRETRVKVRIELDGVALVDLFFREETGRIDYSLIIGGERRFGMDNLGGWHEHPLSAPNAHVPASAPTPDEALRRLRQAADTLLGTE